MPQFTSKVQHNTYEKGEFSDEKARTLEETLHLIKNFPFDKERTHTDIKLTGPSVTIQDPDVNYLKVGLYFNDKFCLYYLDNDNHLYERAVPNIDEVYRLVTDFLEGNLDLDKFDKHLFNFGNQGHFVTKYFEYTVKPLRVFWLTSYLTVYFIMFMVMPLSFNFIGQASPLAIVIGLVPALLLGGLLAFITTKAYQQRNYYMQISKGSPTFLFGYNEESITTYHKSDIKELVNYSAQGTRNPLLIEVFEINFKDGSSIKFSNMLISGIDLYLKFNDANDNCLINLVSGKKRLLKVL